MLKIIIIIIGYTLNNFTTHITISLQLMEKIYNFKIKKEFIFWKKKVIGFVNVETDPRLRYLSVPCHRNISIQLGPTKCCVYWQYSFPSVQKWMCFIFPKQKVYCRYNIKGNFRQGSKVQGPMNSSNLISQKLYIGPKAFVRGSKTKKVVNGG
jgi:hypothetical protein